MTTTRTLTETQLDPFGMPLSRADIDATVADLLAPGYLLPGDLELFEPDPDTGLPPIDPDYEEWAATIEARLTPEEREEFERYGNDFEAAAEDRS